MSGSLKQEEIDSDLVNQQERYLAGCSTGADLRPDMNLQLPLGDASKSCIRRISVIKPEICEEMSLSGPRPTGGVMTYATTTADKPVLNNQQIHHVSTNPPTSRRPTNPLQWRLRKLLQVCRRFGSFIGPGQNPSCSSHLSRSTDKCT